MSCMAHVAADPEAEEYMVMRYDMEDDTEQLSLIIANTGQVFDLARTMSSEKAAQLEDKVLSNPMHSSQVLMKLHQMMRPGSEALCWDSFVKLMSACRMMLMSPCKSAVDGVSRYWPALFSVLVSCPAG